MLTPHICTCVHMHTRAHMRACAHTHMCTHAHTSTHTHTHTHTHTCTHTHTHTHTPVSSTTDEFITWKSSLLSCFCSSLSVDVEDVFLRYCALSFWSEAKLYSFENDMSVYTCTCTLYVCIYCLLTIVLLVCYTNVLLM